MGEGQNTIVCVFDLKSPRISAYDIHEWIYAQLRLEDNEDKLTVYKDMCI